MSDPVTHSARPKVQVLKLNTSRRTELVNVTTEVARLVAASGLASGVCHLYVPHTTAGVTINEGDDPDVARDIEATLDSMPPGDAGYNHSGGNSDLHITSSLVGVSD